MKNKSIFSAFPQTNNEKTDSSIIKYMAYIIRQIDTLKYDELLSLSLICQSIDCMREPDTNNYPNSLKELFPLLKEIYEQDDNAFNYIYDYINSLILSIRKQDDPVDEAAVTTFFEGFD